MRSGLVLLQLALFGHLLYVVPPFTPKGRNQEALHQQAVRHSLATRHQELFTSNQTANG